MKSIIRTKNLSKDYGGRRRVNQLDLNVEKGKIYGLLGPNGAGKTTTMKMLLGLTHPTEGEVILFDREMNQSNRAEILKKTGSLIENPNYYGHLSGLENLKIQEILLDLPRGSSQRALELVGLDEDKDRKVKDYSLGMQQRLGIAAALVRSPKLLILDEPTNGLDPAGIQEIRELLVRLAHEKGVTIMVSSHLLGEIEKIADDVGIINEGKLIYQGSLKNLQNLKQPVSVLETSDDLLASKYLNTFSLDEKGRIVLPNVSRKERGEIVRTLVENGVDIYELKTEEPDLEDLFLSITGGERERIPKDRPD